MILSAKCRVARRLTAAFLFLGLCNTVVADETGVSPLTLSAFGTFSVVHSSEDQADFSNNGLKATGAGYTHQWSADVDSAIGAQLIYELTPKLSATVQVVSEQIYDNSHDPRVEWANLKYQLTPEFSLRVGRTMLSSFMFADTRKVGYAIPWVRPPAETYALIPVANSDGVDATYRVQVGTTSHLFVGTLGQKDTPLPAGLGGGVSRARGLWLISDTIERGPLTLHVAYQKVAVTIPALNTVFDAMRNFGPQGEALADRYGVRHKIARFIGFGASYDPGRWFAIAEWGDSNYHSAIGNRSAWYVSSGYRLGQFTPYLTFSKASTRNRPVSGFDLSQLPPSLAGPAAELNGGLNAILESAPRQHTISAGARWDAFKNAAFKLQYDHIDLENGSTGTLINMQPAFQPGGTVNLFSISVDFVL